MIGSCISASKSIKEKNLDSVISNSILIPVFKNPHQVLENEAKKQRKKTTTFFCPFSCEPVGAGLIATKIFVRRLSAHPSDRGRNEDQQVWVTFKFMKLAVCSSLSGAPLCSQSSEPMIFFFLPERQIELRPFESLYCCTRFVRRGSLS